MSVFEEHGRALAMKALVDRIQQSISAAKVAAKQQHRKAVVRRERSLAHRLAVCLRALAERIDPPEPVLASWKIYLR